MTRSQASERIEKLNSAPLVEVNPRQNFIQIWKKFYTDALQNRRTIALLAKREIRQRYKGSILGVFWSLGRPLLQLFIYFVVVGQLLGASRGISNFAIYIFAGLTIWTFFTEVFGSSSSSIEQNAGLIKKVAIPSNVFPISGALGGTTNFFIQFILVIIASFASGINLDFEMTGLMLVAILGLFFASLGAGLLVSSSSVYIRDIKHFSELALGILFWLSPIVYPLSFVEKFLGRTYLFDLYLLNPVTTAVISLQQFAWNGFQSNNDQLPNNFPTLVWVSFGFSLIFLLASQLVFTKLQRSFGQEL